MRLSTRPADPACAMNGAVETEYVPQNILITGGAGFIGSHVAVRLLERYPQYRVRTTMVVWGL